MKRIDLASHLGMCERGWVRRRRWFNLRAAHGVALRELVFGRAVLLGEAASIPRPHTAGSTTTAAANAHALALALSSASQGGATIDSALQRWENQQLQRGKPIADRGISPGDRVMDIAR